MAALKSVWGTLEFKIFIRLSVYMDANVTWDPTEDDACFDTCSGQNKTKQIFQWKNKHIFN